ncbi:hypothetical protein MNBD_NITROSPIRAE01-693 [hydrothermal vent metagenome]|uniref:Flagellar hook-length control protein-like C-terminal domain-containing protein n=1 Tax=hydrothermal vent metagenome TaxID=652676 RepID=A0A3B1D336_9ZZZZ
MHHLRVSDKTNLEGLSAFLNVNKLVSAQGKTEGFSEVFKGIEAVFKTPASEPLSRASTDVKDNRTRKLEELEKEKSVRSLERQDMAAAQSTTEAENRMDESSEAEASSFREGTGEEVVKSTKENQQADSAQPTKSSTTDLSDKKQDAATLGPNAKTSFSEGEAETDLAPLKDSLDVSKPSPDNSEVSEDLFSLEKAKMKLVKENEAAMGKGTEDTTAVLKTVLAEKRLEKQAEMAAHPSTQQSSEKQGLPVDLKPAVTPGNSTSIIENLQGFALSKSMGIEGGAAGGKAHGGMGQGGTFLGNTAFQLSNLPSNEGSSAMQKTATDFRALMNAGRVIPDEGAVLRQVAQQLRAWRSGQDEPIRFLLEPKNLGRIQIDVSLKEGGLIAHMVTSDPMVKELLERNQHFLQEALKEQGLEMEQFSVDLGDRKGFARDAENTQDFMKSDVFLEEADARDSIQPPQSELQSEDGGLSLYV